MFLSWDEGALVNLQSAFPMACIGGRTGTSCISRSTYTVEDIYRQRCKKQKKMILTYVLLHKAVFEVQKHHPLFKKRN